MTQGEKINSIEGRKENLKQFKKKMEALSNSYEVENIDDYLYVLHGDERNERVRFTVLGLTHGNEVAGFYILEKFISYLEALKIKLPFSVGIALGNYEAYCEGKRFLDCDLNRSFGTSRNEYREQKRAKIISKLLQRTDFLLDFHQTQRPCLSPFFIFPYHEKSLLLAAHLDSRIPIVTHWSGGFSKDGMCTDEYVNSLGGVGISLETGYLLRDSLQISFGFELVLKMIFHDACLKSDVQMSPISESDLKQLIVYSWAHVFPYPSEGRVILNEDLSNFSFIQKGSKLGEVEGLDIRAKEEGYLLFPKYIKSSDPRPKELFRLIKRVSYADLPS